MRTSRAAAIATACVLVAPLLTAAPAAADAVRWSHLDGRDSGKLASGLSSSVAGSNLKRTGDLTPESWWGNDSSWNRYSYVLNNPLLFVDFTGEAETIYMAFVGSDLSDRERAQVMAGVRQRHINAGVTDVSVSQTNSLTSHASTKDDVVSNIEVTDADIGDKFGYTHPLGITDRKNEATVSTARTASLTAEERITFLINVVGHETGHTGRAMREYDFDGLSGAPTGERGSIMEGQIEANGANAKMLGSSVREFSDADAEKLRSVANP